MSPIVLLLAFGTRAFILQSSSLKGIRRGASTQNDEMTRTQRIIQGMEYEGDGAGAGASGTYRGLQGLDTAWEAMKSGTRKEVGTFVKTSDYQSSTLKIENEVDVIVLGGTLGIFMATALQRRGLRVAVVERGPIVGRSQEWNLSLDEVMELVEAGALDKSDVDGALATPDFKEVATGGPNTLVASHFGAVRAGFYGGESAEEQEIWLPQVLNIGVRPDVAVARALARFKDAGGFVYENTACDGVVTRSDFIDALIVSPTESTRSTPSAPATVLRAKLVVDAMGNNSPISRQARTEANGGTEPKPSGVCCVVGTLASGFSLDNSFGDLIFTNENARSDRQLFWESFPACSIGPDARTTYLFTYLDCEASKKHTVEDQFEQYWDTLPIYQRTNHQAFYDGANVETALQEKSLKIHRVLYGLFPTYRDSPLASSWDRILAIGDASGIQSPLSFGGFGALTRHANRIANAISDAISADALTKKELATINCYTPNLSVTWMFQNTFVQFPGRPADFINRLMRENYQIMQDLGPQVLRPFNQDVVQPRSLLAVLSLATVRDPANIPRLVYHIGPSQLADWLYHFFMMLAYDALHNTIGPRLRNYADDIHASDPKGAFRLRRLADAYEYGSGNDYGSHSPPPVLQHH